MSVFGIVPAEVPVIRSLDGLAPKFRARVRHVLRELARKGYDPMVAESLRTDERQRFLFGFGRDYDDGRGIVTHSLVGCTSWHSYGLAVDVVSRSTHWDAPNAFWSALGAAAAVHGLTWGGDWPTFPDKPHLQFAPMPDSPSPAIITTYQASGREAVWLEVAAV